MRAVSKKRQQRDRVYPERRREVFERAGGACEFCLTAPCEQVHHLAGRGGADPHRMSNLVGLCADCHGSAHAHPAWARENGLMRRRVT